MFTPKDASGARARRSGTRGTRGLLVPALILALSAQAATAEAASGEGEPVSPVVVYDDLFSVATLAPEEALAVGGWGRLAHTRDGGRSWDLTSVEAPSALLDIDFGDPSHGWIVGEAGLIVRSRDGGRSWQRQASPTRLHLLAVEAIDGERAVAVGEQGTVLRTEDGGATWLDLSLGEDVILNDVLFSDPTHGWIAGEFGTIRRTEDGGNSWQGHDSIRGAPADVYLYAIRFRGEDGLAVGLGGTLLRSRDSGRTWSALDSGTPNHLFAIDLTSRNAVMVGDQAVIRLLPGDSARPPRRMPEANLWLRDIDLLGEDGYAVGAKAQVLRTRDAGGTWEDVSPTRLLPGRSLPDEVPE